MEREDYLLKTHVSDMSKQDILDLIRLAVKDVKAAMKGELYSFKGQKIEPNMSVWLRGAGYSKPFWTCSACLAGCAIVSRYPIKVAEEVFSKYPAAKFLDLCRYVGYWHTGQLTSINELLISKGLRIPSILRNNHLDTQECVNALENLLAINSTVVVQPATNRVLVSVGE
jgi:hypothetical protein